MFVEMINSIEDLAAAAISLRLRTEGRSQVTPANNDSRKAHSV
jgi:hypothetical protein